VGTHAYEALIAMRFYELVRNVPRLRKEKAVKKSGVEPQDINKSYVMRHDQDIGGKVYIRRLSEIHYSVRV
jgi:hypothetical protein